MNHLVLTLMALLWSLPVLAETPPVPARKSQALNKYEDRLNIETKAKGDLQRKRKSTQKDLSATKQELIETARDIQENESNLKTLENRISGLEERKSILEDKVQTDRKSISRLITALQRLRRNPLESMFAQNQSPYKTAQSALIMGNIIPAINRHAEKLSSTLESLDTITEDLKTERNDLLRQSKTLQTRRDALAKLLEKRQILHAKIDQDLKIREITIQKISLQAKNLEELVARIKREEELEAQRRKAARIKRPKPKPIFKTKPGEAQLPISGVIRTGYNKTDDLGAKSKGLTIEGRSKSLVIAPMNGKVQYTGAFKRYGNIIIIEHTGGYHSLIAGLNTINVSVGAHVKSGEPIGTLPDSSLNPSPTVYYELRRNGKPVNPAKKFAGLG